ncbi:hypothetical protein OB919_01555 [Halobacteria archaeon AArc-curdl1]|uniref:Uncharacterized protein n=1 Tax=Natronosalvus hydrolyticus TaxID=2979988 RepID=A0AAP2Z5V1_9EURY|nr:hypothetical protein [Halobacteria archaeon AArc-curdl1]
MVETEWPELAGTELEYGDHTWELTGAVEVNVTGEAISVGAKQVDDVRQKTATLRFGASADAPSLNPGDLGGHFDRVELVRDSPRLVLRTEARTYRYELRNVEYE